jgi:hypothetical protein
MDARSTYIVACHTAVKWRCFFQLFGVAAPFWNWGAAQGA